MTRKLSCNIRSFIISLLVITGLTGPAAAQKKINGSINFYGRVTAIGLNSVTIPDAVQITYFHPGDTTLLIQMKGIRTYVSETSSYGVHEGTYGSPGQHEFLIIQSVDNGTGIVTFKHIILNSFDIDGQVQLIRVPSYNNVVVDGVLTCTPWDSTAHTGGVLAAIIGKDISLNADINVTGKGFNGGSPALSLPGGVCVEANSIKMYRYAFDVSTDSAGNKGEGPVSKAYLGVSNYTGIYPNYGKGKGANLSSGGGGDGRFSGGGGGGNYGAGGTGGKESGCGFNYNGGIGGLAIKGTIFGTADRLFMGGGGGSSVYLSGANPTAGSNGGGIVILVCENLKGNGHGIFADGATPADIASGSTGAGGGGGGGSIALYLQSYASSVINITANGGKGGNNQSAFGAGGGGGGGFINTSNISIPSGSSKTVNGGAYGTGLPSSNGAPGSAGDTKTSFIPILNGFLFNSIRSSVTGDQIDSICSDTYMGEISGTVPVGGNSPYTYFWEYSVTSESSGFSSAPGTITQINYTPPAKLSQTTWFRRTVTDASGTPIVDISMPVKIIVQQAITGNLIGTDTTICYGQDPHKLRPLNSGPSNGNGRYVYQWFSNNDNATWTTNAPGTSTLSNYDPSALFATTYYQRKVTSGRCVNNSSTVSVTVLPSISGNVTTRPDSVICEGSLFNNLGASAAIGGSGSYIYQWQDSTTSSVWLPAAGTNTNTVYSPDTSKFFSVEHRYYRRVVYSGLNNTCQSKSDPIHLIRYHKIQNNTIAADQTICSGVIPGTLTGLSPTGGAGAGSYSFQWQDSSKTTTWAVRLTSGTNTPYSPAALLDSTWYRRIISSSKCTSNSNKIVINVHKPVTNNIAALLSGPGPDTTVCFNVIPRKIIGSVATGGTNIIGDYAYLWQYSVDGTNYNNVTFSGTLKDYQPTALTVTTWFRRLAVSGNCSSLSNSIRVIVLPLISGNIIVVDKATICYNTIPLPLTTSVAVSGGSGTYTWLWQQSSDGVTWTTATGTSNQQSYTPPALTVKTWFRRMTRSGLYDCCVDTSNVVTIDIYALPTGIITSVADTSLCSGGAVKLRITLTGAPNWNVYYNENSLPVLEAGISSSYKVISRIPSVSGTMTTFNYSLASITDGHGCVATSLSGTRKADVYHTPVADAGSNNEVCGPACRLAAMPTFGTGVWSFPSQVLSGTASNPTTLVKIDSSFTTANVSYWFIWKETNWLCTSKDSARITFDNRIDTVNAGPAGEIMTFDNIAKVDAYPLLSYESGLWSVVEGNGDFEDNTASSTYVRNIAIGNNIYKWTVTNGVCKLEDTLLYAVSHPVIPEGISPDGNDINDTLKISGLDLNIQEAELKILSGAGTLVFSTTNRNGNVWKDWTGKDSKGGSLNEGTYYYLLNVTSKKTGHVAKVSGFVILKRH
jgi:hypothetical protein